MLRNIFDIHADQEVNDFIKEKIEEWDFEIASIEVMEHYCFCGDFEIFLVSMQ